MCCRPTRRSTLHACEQAMVAPNCSTLVTPPLDYTPVRSPQAVHSVLARHFRHRDVIELGTRFGDGMMCFAQVASNATAVERDVSLCEILRERSAGLRNRTGHSFTTICSRFQEVERLDADYFTWWMGSSELNGIILEDLRMRYAAGRIRKHATALVLFEAVDQDWPRLRHLSRWSEDVDFDERSLTRKLAHRKPWMVGRANGTMTVGAFRLSDIPTNVRSLVDANAPPKSSHQIEKIERAVGRRR